MQFLLLKFFAGYIIVVYEKLCENFSCYFLLEIGGVFPAFWRNFTGGFFDPLYKTEFKDKRDSPPLVGVRWVEC
jgi:hypothetical protein